MLTSRIPMKLRGASLVALKIAAIVATSGLLFAISFYISIRMVISGNEVSVPDLTGATLERSREMLEEAGLAVDLTAERFDPAVPAGEVITQMPAPGAATKLRRKVRVVISRGTEMLAVPDLTGETEQRAALELERLGLDLGEVSRVTADGPPDRIVAQDPMPGTEIFRGDRVSLLVSRGRRDPVYVMPDFHGRTLSEVQLALDAVGFKLSRTSFQRDRARTDTVLRQFPLPGYPVTRRDAITVVVSRGPSV